MRNERLRDQLDAQHPERKQLRPTTVEGMREAFDFVEAMWAPTIDRARALPADKVHERVNNEYSFVETHRHMLFAIDAWVTRVAFGVPGYHGWSVPPDHLPDEDTDSRPQLDAVLDVRRERWQRIREYLSTATTNDLMTVKNAPDEGWVPGSHRVLDCLVLILREEWWHHRYAARDLAILEQQA
ncbi:MAG: DinB family protein [Actinomycetota bacterium]